MQDYGHPEGIIQHNSLEFAFNKTMQWHKTTQIIQDFIEPWKPGPRAPELIETCGNWAVL